MCLTPIQPDPDMWACRKGREEEARAAGCRSGGGFLVPQSPQLCPGAPRHCSLVESSEPEEPHGTGWTRAWALPLTGGGD